QTNGWQRLLRPSVPRPPPSTPAIHDGGSFLSPPGWCGAAAPSIFHQGPAAQPLRCGGKGRRLPVSFTARASLPFSSLRRRSGRGLPRRLVVWRRCSSSSMARRGSLDMERTATARRQATTVPSCSQKQRASTSGFERCYPSLAEDQPVAVPVCRAIYLRQRLTQVQVRMGRQQAPLLRCASWCNGDLLHCGELLPLPQSFFLLICDAAMDAPFIGNLHFGFSVVGKEAQLGMREKEILEFHPTPRLMEDQDHLHHLQA
ncbi:hypothetical protein EJB05_40485, partial [Eragrostis curvula]